MEYLKKEVSFHNDKVLTAMKDKKLYVGVSNICLNLGMSKKMKDRQVSNIQSDIVLLRGCLKFEVGVFDPNNSTLAIEIEFLPIWLAKIRITPNMIEEKKELVEKLIDYQLHAKEVLAEAFLGKREVKTVKKENDIKYNPYLNEIHDRELILRGLEEEKRNLLNEIKVINKLIHFNYHMIAWRAQDMREIIYKETQETSPHFETNFILNGRMLTTEEINKLNDGIKDK